MSALLILVQKCTLAASRPAPGESRTDDEYMSRAPLRLEKHGTDRLSLQNASLSLVNYLI